MDRPPPAKRTPNASVKSHVDPRPVPVSTTGTLEPHPAPATLGVPTATQIATLVSAPLATPVATATAPSRLLSLDVFRGLTIAGMLLVNNPGTWAAIYPPLEHAEWNGWTPTDLIFPFFLFIVGVTTHLSLSARRARGASDRDILLNVVRRGAIIVLLGWLMAAFPYYPLTRITEMRIPGVLPRIGVAYIFGALLTTRTTLKQQVVILAVLLYGYWFLQTLVPVPGQNEIGLMLLNRPDATLSAWLDRTLLGGHLWINSRTWDPEGLLSTIPAIGTVILGVITGRWLTRRDLPLAERLNGMFVAGAVGMMVGLMWNWSFPINKSLWTSSYVMFTAGMGCLALAACVWLVDIHHIRWWTRPFVIFGTNPIIAFVGSGVLARIIYSLIHVRYGGEVVSLEEAIYKGAFASWLAPRDASLAFAVMIVLFWLAILTVLYRKKIFLKV